MERFYSALDAIIAMKKIYCAKKRLGAWMVSIILVVSYG